MSDRITPAMREYLEVLEDLLNEGKGWPILHAITSVEAVLSADRLDLGHETDYLRARLEEVRRARESTSPPAPQGP